MKPESKKYTATVGRHTLTFETGKLAGQAGGAVTFQLNDTVIFACAATMSNDIREGIDFFPLKKMKKAGGFQGAFFIPSVLPYVWPNCAFRDVVPGESYPAPLARIDAAVAEGKPVILQVDWNKKAGVQTHFVLVKERKGNDYVLYDPYKYPGDVPEKEVLLTSRYKYNGATLEKEISAVIWFDSYSSAPSEPPKVIKVPVPADAFKIFAIEDDLALRAEPDRTGYLWKRLVKGTELTCLEPKEVVKKKLGVNGQWINVQEPAGDQGHVAAWYVSD